MLPREIPPEERIALLDELDRKEAVRSRRAARAAWISVVLAAVVMMSLLGAGSWRLHALRSETRTADTELKAVQDKLALAARDLADKEAQLQRAASQIAAVSSALGSIDATQSRAAVEKEVARDPEAAKLLPRIYLQITNRDDRAWAMEMGKVLQNAGFLVLGVEYVSKASPVPQTEVRFYKKGDEAVAERIVTLLRQAGIATLPPIHLKNLEDNPKFRSNQFEVWFGPRPS